VPKSPGPGAAVVVTVVAAAAAAVVADDELELRPLHAVPINTNDTPTTIDEFRKRFTIFPLSM
jgi:hypothetical protein